MNSLEHLILKKTSLDDKEIEQLVFNSPDLLNMSETRSYPPGTETEMNFRIENEGILIGQAKLTRIRWGNRKAEISILIKKEYQGKGFGREAMLKILDFLFNELNFHRAEAEVIEYNTSSIKMIEKLGFKKEGILREAKFTNKRFWNIYRYGLLKNEFVQN